MRKYWNGWWILGFGVCMFMWGAFLEGHLNKHEPRESLVFMISVFTLVTFFGSIKKNE